MKNNNVYGDNTNKEKQKSKNSRLESIKNKDEEFSLYTEHIEKKFKEKYKLLYFFLQLMIAAIAFGVIAGLVMALAYPWYKNQLGVNQTTRNPIVFDRDTYVKSDYAVGSNTESSEEKEYLPIDNEEFSNMVEHISKSIVEIKSDKKDKNQEERLNSTVGIIIGHIDGEYIIMTDADFVKKQSNCVAKFNDDCEVKAILVSSDEYSGIAIIAVNESELKNEIIDSLGIAEVGNSYILEQNDNIVAYGNLYGSSKVANQGKVIGTSMESSIDNSYDIVETDIATTEGNYSFLFSRDGLLIGVSRSTKTDNRIRALGISSLKPMIELLSTGKEKVYLGLKCTNITDTTAGQYNLPNGVYISSVVIDSPAYSSGIQAGDVIVKYGEHTIETTQTLNEYLCKESKGNTIKLTVKRAGKDDYKELEFTIILDVR